MPAQGRPSTRVLRFAIEFNAPPAYVFRWCTDYRSTDPGLSGDRYQRRVVRRTPREVVYEDLWWEKDGWRWRWNRVRLDPPRGWHSDSLGSVRSASIDYRLLPRAGGRTRLTIRMRRRSTLAHPAQPSAAAWEADMRRMWSRYRTALESDHRRSRAPRR